MDVYKADPLLVDSLPHFLSAIEAKKLARKHDWSPVPNQTVSQARTLSCLYKQNVSKSEVPSVAADMKEKDEDTGCIS